MDEYYNLASAYAEPIVQMAQLNNSWSAEQAQKQMDFQREMSNTAHQREIADLKAAGLNPVLSAKLGGASTPSGAKAEADTSVISAMASILDKVMDIAQTSAEATLESASNSGNGYYGISYNNKSGKEGLEANTVSGLLGLLGIRLPNSASQVLTDANNGLAGNENTNRKSSQVYDFFKGIRDVGEDIVNAVIKPIKEGKAGADLLDGVKDEFNKWKNDNKAVIDHFIDMQKVSNKEKEKIGMSKNFR